jgi:1-acyl-sn-glycerol-3-phosphate acyltransferase
MTRRAAALAAFIAKIRVAIAGEENKLPDPCIFVANHSSYVDALVLCLAFKSPVTFIAKAELGAHPLARWTFERLGVVFVERYDRTKALEDTKRTVELVKQGVNILSFPEGTFTRKPGLLPFHLGPFSAAVDTGRVIAPIAIKGTRSVLHPDSWILRAGQVIVRFLPTIDTRDDQWVSSDYPERQWTRAIKLRDKARAEIIEHCGEVDLGEERVIT